MELPQIIEDFRRRYGGTYVRVKFPNTNELGVFYVSRVDYSADFGGQLTLDSRKCGTIRLNLGTDHGINFAWPKVGVYQFGPRAVFFLRVPARQWARGICTSNAYVGTYALLNSGDVSLDIDTVEAAYEHQTYSYSEAIEKLKSKAFQSVAMPNNFSVSLDCRANDKYLLWHWRNVVASVSKQTPGEVAEMFEPIYTKEVGIITSSLL